MPSPKIIRPRNAIISTNIHICLTYPITDDLWESARKSSNSLDIHPYSKNKHGCHPKYIDEYAQVLREHSIHQFYERCGSIRQFKWYNKFMVTILSSEGSIWYHHHLSLMKNYTLIQLSTYLAYNLNQLEVWKLSYKLNNLFFILFHQITSLMSWYIFIEPWCIKFSEWSTSSIILYRSLSISETHNLSLYLKTSFSHIQRPYPYTYRLFSFSISI